VSSEADLLGEFEEHSPAGIRAVLAAGVSPTAPIDGKRPIDVLIEMYLRSSRFVECLQVTLDAGAELGDPLLEAVLLDDDAGLRRLLSGSSENLHRKLNPLCAFTSCRGVSALHICAEFNSTRCARVLLDAGADVNARADRDADGVGGQTPIFHAVNSIFNYCGPMMEILVDAGADLDLRVRSLLWGESMNRETVVYDSHSHFLRSVRSLPAVSSARGGCLQQHRIPVSQALRQGGAVPERAQQVPRCRALAGAA